MLMLVYIEEYICDFNHKMQTILMCIVFKDYFVNVAMKLQLVNVHEKKGDSKTFSKQWDDLSAKLGLIAILG